MSTQSIWHITIKVPGYRPRTMTANDMTCRIIRLCHDENVSSGNGFARSPNGSELVFINRKEIEVHCRWRRYASSEGIFSNVTGEEIVRGFGRWLIGPWRWLAINSDNPHVVMSRLLSRSIHTEGFHRDIPLRLEHEDELILRHEQTGRCWLPTMDLDDNATYFNIGSYGRIGIEHGHLVVDAALTALRAHDDLCWRLLNINDINDEY